MKSKAYFVSDLHFGANYTMAYPDRESRFCEFIRTIQKEASHLFILGDLFEFWMEYRFYIPKQHFKLLAALHHLAASGTTIHYLSGNHDFNLGQFFQNEVNIRTHHTPLEITVQNKSLFLFHGDGMAQSDWKYRIVKKIILHPLSNFLFKLLHPDWGMYLAHWVGSTSRSYPNHSNKGEYSKAALEILSHKKAHILMHGHTHSSFIRETPHGLYINSGEWLRKLQYVVMEEGVCQIKEYTPSATD